MKQKDKKRTHESNTWFSVVLDCQKEILLENSNDLNKAAKMNWREILTFKAFYFRFYFMNFFLIS